MMEAFGGSSPDRSPEKGASGHEGRGRSKKTKMC